MKTWMGLPKKKHNPRFIIVHENGVVELNFCKYDKNAKRK
jgi:hypothetical protein